MSESSFVTAAKKISTEVVAQYAAEVDADARFPHEAFAALKQARLLGAYVPKEYGGGGASLTELVEICEILGKQCSATAMIFAMHQIQVITIVRHGLDSAWYRDYLRELCEKQLLIASVTSEVGVGGEMRTSRCAVEVEGERFKLVKDATTISYGEQADELLVTARRSPDASGSDQSLILVRKAEYTLEKKGTWDAMGLRGTCSPAFLMTSSGKVEQIMTQPFAEMASQTVVPVSHLLWAGCWLGTSSAAVSKARAFVRGQALASPGKTPPTALRLAELLSMMQSMRTSIHDCLREYEELILDPEAATGRLTSISYALKMNNLKIDGSMAMPQIVSKALMICGILGYKNDNKFSMGRHIRDAQSAMVMVGNDRILATNANLLLVLKDD